MKEDGVEIRTINRLAITLLKIGGTLPSLSFTLPFSPSVHLPSPPSLTTFLISSSLLPPLHPSFFPYHLLHLLPPTPSSVARTQPMPGHSVGTLRLCRTQAPPSFKLLAVRNAEATRGSLGDALPGIFDFHRSILRVL